MKYNIISKELNKIEFPCLMEYKTPNHKNKIIVIATSKECAVVICNKSDISGYFVGQEVFFENIENMFKLFNDKIILEN